MKKTFFYLAAFLLLFEVQGGNIIKNGNFIQQDSKGNPLNWSYHPVKRKKSVRIVLDNTNSKSGGQSICITNPDEKC